MNLCDVRDVLFYLIESKNFANIGTDDTDNVDVKSKHCYIWLYYSINLLYPIEPQLFDLWERYSSDMEILKEDLVDREIFPKIARFVVKELHDDFEVFGEENEAFLRAFNGSYTPDSLSDWWKNFYRSACEEIEEEFLKHDREVFDKERSSYKVYARFIRLWMYAITLRERSGLEKIKDFSCSLVGLGAACVGVVATLFGLIRIRVQAGFR